MATVRIKDPWREKRLFETRAVFAGAIIFLMTLTLLGRLYQLQIVRHDYYAELANGNRVRTEPIPAARGVIMDRNGEKIATSRPTYQLELVPEDTVDEKGNPNIKNALASLADLGLIRAEEVPELQRTIRAHRSFDSVPLLLHMSDDEVARFAVHRWEFRGVNIETRQTRYYPNGELAVHALGYVSAISGQDLEQIDRSAYAGTSLIGKLGVEQAYEPQLHGRDGSKDVLVNAAGRSVGVSQSPLAADLKSKPAIAGEDLYLSLDLTVQRAAEEGLAGHQGAVVALDPNNGDVLALASLPGFDPTLFAQGITRPQYHDLQSNPAIPLLNRALRGAYPPGSTVKPMLALAGLTYHTVDPDRKFTCIGQFHVPGSSKIMHEFHNDKHGTLTLDDAIIRSCDSYFYTVAEVMGVDRMSSFMGPFGYGKPTQIDISGEKAGILPSRDWKAHAFKRAADQIWFPGETVNMGVGQGYLAVTPIQQAHYAAIMAMRGKSFRPRLVIGYKDDKGMHNLAPKSDGDVTDILRVAPEDWERIRADMVGVTTKPPPGEGTAYLAFNACAPTLCATPKTPYVAGGKTGTAQVYSVQEGEKYDSHNEALRDHSWFIAFAPAERPRIAVAVIVEHGGSGAGAAAPIARKVLDAYLLDKDSKLKPSPDDPPAPPDPSPAALSSPAAPASLAAPEERKAEAPVAAPTAAAPAATPAATMVSHAYSHTGG